MLKAPEEEPPHARWLRVARPHVGDYGGAEPPPDGFHTMTHAMKAAVPIEKTMDGIDRWTFECHRRCGNRPTITLARAKDEASTRSPAARTWPTSSRVLPRSHPPRRAASTARRGCRCPS